MKSWHELFCSYESAKYLMEQAFIFDQEDILTIDLICGLEGSREAVTIQWMEMLIEVGEVEGIKRAIGMFRDYCTWNLLTESQIKLMLVQDVVQLQMRLSKKYASLALSDEVMEQLLKMLMAAEGLKELLGCYEQALMDLKIGRAHV